MALRFGLEDKPPAGGAVLYGLQHLLIMFSAMVTSPLVIGQLLGLSGEFRSAMITGVMLGCGVGTLISALGVGERRAASTSARRLHRRRAVVSAAGLAAVWPGVARHRRTDHHRHLSRRRRDLLLILAASFGRCAVVNFAPPAVFEIFPPALRILAGDGIVVGTLVAVLLNLASPAPNPRSD